MVLSRCKGDFAPVSIGTHTSHTSLHIVCFQPPEERATLQWPVTHEKSAAWADGGKSAGGLAFKISCA